MNEVEPIPGSTHGSEDSSKSSNKPTSHHSADEDEEEDNKQEENSKDSTKEISHLNSSRIAEDPKFEINLRDTTEDTDNENDNPISSLEKIAKDRLSPFERSTVLSRRGEQQVDSEEELLDIQAIEEDVHRSQNTSANEIRLSKGAGSIDQYKPSNHSNPTEKSSSSTGVLKGQSTSTPSAKISPRHRKRTIPVGIAVAWQRNSSETTTAASTPNSTSTTMSVVEKLIPKSKKTPKSPSIPVPLNCISEASITSQGNGSLSLPLKESTSKVLKKSNKPSKRKSEELSELNRLPVVGAKIPKTMKNSNNNNNSLTVNLNCNNMQEKDEEKNDFPDRAKSNDSYSGSSSISLPSTVVGSNRSSNSQNNCKNERYNGDGFRSLNNSSNNSSYQDSWPSSQLLVPQGYAAAAAYLQHQQQLSMHQTMQLQLSHSYGYNSISSCIYAGYPADSLLQYEQFLRQQQQQQIERHDQEQKLSANQQTIRERIEIARQLSSVDGIRSPLNPSSSSPRISIPTPSPAHIAAQQQPSPYSQHSFWPTDLYQHYQQLIPPPAHQYQYQSQHQLIQQQMMTATSSTPTLSPRSLSSATPSPITVHDSNFQSLFNRKCITPNPTSKNFPLFSSPFSPSLVPIKDIWKEEGDGKLTPIPLVTNSRKKSSTISSLGDVEDNKGEQDFEFGSRKDASSSKYESRQLASPSMQNYKHDFRRMESLIEKRAEGSLPLLSSSSSSLMDSLEQDDEEAVNLKIVKPDAMRVTPNQDLVVKDEAEVVKNCDGKLVVPEPNSTVLNLNAKKEKKPRKTEPKKNLSKNVNTKKTNNEKGLCDKISKKSQKPKLCNATSKAKKVKIPGDDEFELGLKPKIHQESRKSTSNSNKKACKKDTHKIINDKDNSKKMNNSKCSRSISKKSPKYFKINNNNPVDDNTKNLCTKSLSSYDTNYCNSSNTDISNNNNVSRIVDNVEEVNKGKNSISGTPNVKIDQQIFSTNDQIKWEDNSKSLPTKTVAGANSIETTSQQTLNYCDKAYVANESRTFDLKNSLTSSDNSKNSPVLPSSPTRQYQHQFHSVFSSHQTPVDRRLSNHNSQIENTFGNNHNTNNNLIFNSLPKIVISPEENHLNLLATVAEEVGPYISSRNISPTHQRTFDIMVNENHHNSDHDDCSLRRHSTESLYAAVAAAAAAEESNRRNLLAKEIHPDEVTSPQGSSSNDDSNSSPNKPLIESTLSSHDNPKNSFELKIPHVVPRRQDSQKTKKKVIKQQEEKLIKSKKQQSRNLAGAKTRQNKKMDNINTQSKQIKKKVSSKEKDAKPKIKKNFINSWKNTPDSSRGGIDKKKYILTKTRNLNSNSVPKRKKNNLIAPKVDSSFQAVSNSTTSTSSCIYDFDDTESLYNLSENSLHKNNQAKKFSSKSINDSVSEEKQKPSKTVKKSDLKKDEGGIKKKSKPDLETAFKNRNNKLAQRRQSAINKASYSTLNINIVKNRKSLIDKKEKIKNLKDTSKLKKTEISKVGNNELGTSNIVRKKYVKKQQKITNYAAAAADKTSNTALVGKKSTEISPAVANNFSIKNEIVSSNRALPIFTNIPSSRNPLLNDVSNSVSSSNESSSSAWITITNPAHIVSAIKTEPKDDDEQELINKIAASKRSLIDLPSKLSDGTLRSIATEELPIRPKICKDSFSESQRSPRISSPKRKHSKDSDGYIKPCLKVEPIVRSNKEGEDVQESRSLRQSRASARIVETKSGEKIKIRKPSIDMNIFSRKIKTDAESTAECQKMEDEETWNDNVVIAGVDDMIDDMRVLTEIQGLFYTGKLNALQPPDVYGVTLDNERGAPPHIIFSAEEVLAKCIREAKPWKPSQLPHGLRICAYWSPMYTGLYSGKVSTDYDKVGDLVPVEFDDGDTGVIKIGEIRLLAPNHPVAEYDPNPLLTLEKKHRKRRNSSANGSQGGCTGDHEERDCGEPYCVKVAKLQEEEDEQDEEDEDDRDFNDTYRTKMKYWTWTGLGYKNPKTKKDRHKEFFDGIQRGDEIINVGDSALFISNGNDRPFIGRIERFWEKKGQKIVNVRWFYHPEEVKTKKRFVIKCPGALFESPHIDENDVQTIAKKCEVIPFEEYKQKYGTRLRLNWKTGKSGHHIDNRKTAPKHSYYVAGFYDPYTYKLKMKDLK